MSIPRRQAGTQVIPQAVDFRGVHIVVFDQNSPYQSPGLDPVSIPQSATVLCHRYPAPDGSRVMYSNCTGREHRFALHTRNFGVRLTATATSRQDNGENDALCPPPNDRMIGRLWMSVTTRQRFCRPAIRHPIAGGEKGSRTRVCGDRFLPSAKVTWNIESVYVAAICAGIIFWRSHAGERSGDETTDGLERRSTGLIRITHQPAGQCRAQRQKAHCPKLSIPSDAWREVYRVSCSS